MSRGVVFVVGSALLLSATLAGTLVAQEPSASPSAGTGITGPGLAALAVPDGTVGVVAAGALSVDAPRREDQTTILAIVGNGTDVPVEAIVAWAAAAPDGSLLWAGEIGGGRSSVNDILLTGTAPDVIGPGGFGLVIGSVDRIGADATWTFAARGDEADEDEPSVSIVSAALADGRIAGELVVDGEEPVERGFSVIGICLGTDGAITAGNGLYIDVDDPVAPGGGATFDLDPVSAACEDFVVAATGS